VWLQQHQGQSAQVHLSNKFLTQIVVKHGQVISPLFFKFALKQNWPVLRGPRGMYLWPSVTWTVPVVQLNKYNRSTEHNVATLLAQIMLKN